MIIDSFSFNKIPRFNGRSCLLYLMALMILFVFPIQLFNQKAYADEFDERIKASQRAIEESNAMLIELSNKSNTLQGAISQLVGQISIIQSQIDISQAKYDQLIIQISETEIKIKDSQDSLGEIIADMYVSDEITPIEMIAGSGTVGEFLDRQEYRSSVRSEMTVTITKIKNLKNELETQKIDVGIILSDQKIAREDLSAKKSEQQRLLDETRGQESIYQEMVALNKTEIEKIRNEQAAYLASLAPAGSTDLNSGDPNKGGYPAYLANAGQDTLVDPWGMYNRECVSYVAWKVHEAHLNNPSQYRHDMPYWGGIGNAWQWAYSGYKNWGGVQYQSNSNIWHRSNADSYGIPSGYEPKIGSAAVSNGQYGHIAWVEDVRGDQIYISQYNWNRIYPNPSGWGQYSEGWVSKSIFGRYIYFGEW